MAAAASLEKNCHLLRNTFATEYKVGILIVAWLKVDKNVNLNSGKIKQHNVNNMT